MRPLVLLIIALSVMLPASPVAAQWEAGPRMVAEWEPALGTLIRWPLGIPMALVVELARDDTLYTLVETSGTEQQARSTFAAAGVDLGRVVFIRGNLWSMWTRDWGPQAVVDAAGRLAYADPWFDGYPWVPGCADAPAAALPPPGARQGRGYEEDDALPAVVAAHLQVPHAPLGAYLTGGNIMTDGLGTAWSTRQMVAENAPAMSEAVFRQRVQDVMGIDDYRFILDPEVFGIQHIDCYAKLLDEETVMVKQVPSWHPEAACCDAVAAAFANALSAYGRPFRVHRVLCPGFATGSAAAYTNSLILNRKVLVPTFGIAADQAALDAYAAAMPGYQVLGFAHDDWYEYDALHCRTMGLFDPGMLRLLHAPLAPEQPAGTALAVEAWVDDRSEAGLAPGAQVLHWREVGAAAWQEAPLQAVAGEDHAAVIPPQQPGTVLEYRLEAADLTGRQASSPRGAWPAAHRVTVTGDVTTTPASVSSGLRVAPNPFNPRTVITLVGAAGQWGEVVIHDLRGRRVRGLHRGALQPGLSLTWDGTDDIGRAVPSGTYLAVLRTDGRREVARLLLGR